MIADVRAIRQVSVLATLLAALTVSGAAQALDPASFAQVASGVVLIKATNCRGGGFDLGSGFFVGSSVVMTATHVSRDCRSARVLVNGKRWVSVTGSIDWNDRGTGLDVSTLKLAESLDDVWLFSLRTSQIPAGGGVAALGHPLGEGLSYTNGHVLFRIGGQQMVLKILSAQGMSGGPVVDANERVVGVISWGKGSPGAVTGAYTGDNLVAYDLSSKWGTWRRTLCHTYRFGGIADCPTSAGSGPSTPTPPPGGWPPLGFKVWTGQGAYTPGTLAWRLVPGECGSDDAGKCWGVEVVSRIGCASGAFATVDSYNASGQVVDRASAWTKEDHLAPNQVGHAKGHAVPLSAVSYKLVLMECTQ